MLDSAFEGDFSDADWEHALGGHHALVVEAGRILAHGAVVERAIELNGIAFRAGYVEAVATAAAQRRRGHGSAVMRALEDVIRRDFDLGVLSTGRTGFYERLGWTRWNGPTFVRHADRLERTADEDAGILVLRFGRSAQVAPGVSISCEARSGEAW